jgi:hypothetical protein
VKPHPDVPTQGEIAADGVALQISAEEQGAEIGVIEAVHDRVALYIAIANIEIPFP